MTISLMNAGRGAGKTHALVQWAKQNKNRLVIGTHGGTGDAMEEAGLKDQFVHLNDAKQTLIGRSGGEVAIDNLEDVLSGVLAHEFGINLSNSVILATNLPVWDGAPKVSEVPVSDWYSEAVKKKFGEGFEGVAFLSEALKNGAEALGPLLGVVFPQEQGEQADPAKEEEVPDTKQVRMDELRLGDVLPGRGKVVSLRYDTTQKDRVVAILTDAGFEGKLIKLTSSLVEIENK